MKKILEHAVTRANKAKTPTVGWSYGQLRSSLESLHIVLIASVIRSPGTGFEGWQYLPKERFHKQLALEALEDTLTATLMLLKAVQE